MKCKNFEVEFNSSSWSMLQNSRSEIDVLQKCVLKFFKNYTRKHLCWSIFLIKFIKNRLRHRLFPLKFGKFLWKPFIERPSCPPVTAYVFCIRTLSILVMRTLILILEDSMWLQLIYFLNISPFWFVECLFPIDETRALAN